VTCRLAVPAAALAALAALVAGCGQAEQQRAPGPPPPVLPAQAVPYLPSNERPVTAAWLARETGLPELTGRLEGWGFDAGARRYFQGQSRRLQLVDSRALRFRDAAGAAAFVRYVRTKPASFLGGGKPAGDFESRGRRGIVVKGAPCSCHLATPVLLAVVAGGPTVTWLEINGPRASRKALDALAARAP
jgi:hypothetical protein